MCVCMCVCLCVRACGVVAWKSDGRGGGRMIPVYVAANFTHTNNSGIQVF